MSKNMLFRVALVAQTLLLVGSAMAEEAADRGHRILLEKGLQIEARVYPWTTSSFDLNRWQDSNFTSANFETVNSVSWLGTAPGIPWSRVDPGGHAELTAMELSYLTNMVGFQYRDEQNLSDPAEVALAATWLASNRTRYPNVLGYTNQWGTTVSTTHMRTYMQQAQPDMVMFDTYPFKGSNPAGGSPTELYNTMVKYRNLGLGGNDATGNTPIPYALYLQTFKGGGWDRFPSDSEMRLNQFAAWTFGYTFVTAWVYNAPNSTYQSPFFNGLGDGSPTAAFNKIAETNRQSRNLGKTLVRLLSTDVRFIAGKHMEEEWQWWPPGYVDVVKDNDTPSGMSAWNSSADPYITNISASNLGNKNDGLKGDVLVGYFEPLLESDDGPEYNDEIYFMIANGLSDKNGLVSETRQQITIDFDFGVSGIDSLQRLSRETGLVEVVSLLPLGGGGGGSQYRLALTLDGGTGDLFKFNTGAPFIVPEPASLGMVGCSLLVAMLVRRRF
ncbi:MAG: hypothetical protein GWP14_00285 [Actinobacteria bacterium]|nr:hypothetical protein [Actinomycetota bacterium]